MDLRTYDDGARAQQPDLLLQSHPVRDLLLLPAVRGAAARSRAEAAVLPVHVHQLGSGPVRPVLRTPVLLSFMRSGRLAPAQQADAVRARMLNRPVMRSRAATGAGQVLLIET